MGNREIAFGVLMRKRREEMGYSRKDVADLLGYKNAVKGIRRVERLEDGWIVEVVLEKVMKILRVAGEERVVCREEDERREYEWKLANPVIPHVVVRLMAAVYMRRGVPEGVSEEEMLEFARGVAMERGWRCWLVISHWVRYGILGDGSWKREENISGGPAGRLDVGLVVKVVTEQKIG